MEENTEQHLVRKIYWISYLTYFNGDQEIYKNFDTFSELPYSFLYPRPLKLFEA